MPVSASQVYEIYRQMMYSKENEAGALMGFLRKISENRSAAFRLNLIIGGKLFPPRKRRRKWDGNPFTRTNSSSALRLTYAAVTGKRGGTAPCNRTVD